MNESNADIRTKRLKLYSFICFLIVSVLMAPSDSALKSDEPKREKSVIDATTLHHKVLCGYQGWFRCLGDPAKEGWRHWSGNATSLTTKSLTFEMWPDLTEFSDE